MRFTLKNVSFRFTIKHPTSGRAVFKIEKRDLPKKTSKTLKHPDLDAINAAFKTGQLTQEKALEQVLELRERLYKEAGATRAIVHNEENQRLANAYWEDRFSRRQLVDPKTARYELDRAVDAVGTLSLYSASASELQDTIRSKNFKPNKARRIVGKLNLLLAYAGRKETQLIRPKPEKKRVKYLTESEFKLVVAKVPLARFQILMTVAFYSGGRIGELFAIGSENFNEKKLELRIETQIDLSQLERETKNRRERIALVFPQGVKALKQWFRIKHEIDAPTRKYMARIVKSACKEVFPNDPRKHLVFHDLRHCYAIMLRERGLTTEDVADLIGDSLIVAKEHYSGFGESPAIMDLRRRAISRKRAA